MPNDFAADAIRMAEAFGWVAAGAIPVGAVAWLLARSLGRPLLRPWRKPEPFWTGLEVVLIGAVYLLGSGWISALLSDTGALKSIYGDHLPPSTVQRVPDPTTSIVYGLWGRILALPILVAVAFGMPTLTSGRKPCLNIAEWPGQFAVGVLAWLALTPTVLSLFALTLLANDLLDGPTDPHPVLDLLGNNEWGGPVLVGASVIVVAPLDEELIFRWVLLNWLVRRKQSVWVAAGLIGLMAITQIGGRLPAAVFGAALFLTVIAVGFLPQRWPKRALASVVGTAGLFAVVHSSVWPSPIPLFVLGVGLGWLALRTRGLVACVVAHSLFNTVSFVYLLRGGGVFE